MAKIVEKDNKVLRKKALSVKKVEFDTNELRKTLQNMKDTLEQEPDGVALAAPQIDVSKRIFIVSPKVYAVEDTDKKFIFINPKIIKRSRDKKLMDEGCLSIRWWYGKIRRSSRVTLEAYDMRGNKFEVLGTGLLAQIFQHETDHLDGILFTDNATDLRELPPKDDGK